MFRHSTSTPAEAEKYLRRHGFVPAGAYTWQRITRRHSWLAIVVTTGCGCLATWWHR